MELIINSLLIFIGSFLFLAIGTAAIIKLARDFLKRLWGLTPLFWIILAFGLLLICGTV